MQHLFTNTCGTALFFDMRFILVSEVFQGTQNRIRSCLSQAAQSCFLNILGQVFQQLDIALASLSFCNTGKNFQHTLRAFAAGSTFAAGFRLRKVQEEPGNVNHAGILIHNNQTAAAHHSAGSNQRIIIYRQIQHAFWQTAAGRTADLYSLKLFAVGNTAADIIDNLAHGNTHRHLCQTGIIDFASQSENLGALGFFSTQLTVPVCAVNDNLRHVSKGFYVVDVRRLAPQAADRREWRTRARHTALAFDRSHQGGFFAANKGTGALFDMNSKAEIAFKNMLA